MALTWIHLIMFFIKKRKHPHYYGQSVCVWLYGRESVFACGCGLPKGGFLVSACQWNGLSVAVPGLDGRVSRRGEYAGGGEGGWGCGLSWRWTDIKTTKGSGGDNPT